MHKAPTTIWFGEGQMYFIHNLTPMCRKAIFFIENHGTHAVMEQPYCCTKGSPTSIRWMMMENTELSRSFKIFFSIVAKKGIKQ